LIKYLIETSMKKYFLFLIFIMLYGGTRAQLKDATLDDIWMKNTFNLKSVDAYHAMKDGRSYVQFSGHDNEHKELAIFDYATGNKIKTLISAENLKRIFGDTLAHDLNDLVWSGNETKVLVPTDIEKIYRHSRLCNFVVYDINTHTVQAVSTQGKQQEATFSPDATMVAFVRDNDLFYKDLATGKETQVTTDGKRNAIINGIPDWVYEEEFAFSRAYEWSPDGKKLAWIRFDETQVPEYTLQYFNDHYPDNYTYKYPKVGEKNSVVSVLIYNLDKGRAVRVDVGSDTDQYIPRIKWRSDSNSLCITRLNRLQDSLELLAADAANGNTMVFFKEGNKRYEEISDDLTFLKDNSFIWTSYADGYHHIYHYDPNGHPIQQVTKGNWDVTALYGVDEKKKIVYYQSAEVSPLERYVYSINLDGGNKKQLTLTKGWNDAQFNPAFTCFLNDHSDVNTPDDYTISNNEGKVLRVLQDNKEMKELVAQYKISRSEFFTFKTSDGIILNGWMMKPIDFDASKKYPVLMHVYGGPGSQQVMNRYMGKRDQNLNYLCQKGYIIACIDNRGTGARGEEFMKCTYLYLGKLETQDQVAGAKYLSTLPYIDASRIGIIGWSYGGYMSSMCLEQGAGVFKTAVAIAPVTDWRFYDSAYTERYMRTNKENKEGYDITAPVLHTDMIKGNYLLVAGLADDNVHYQNTAQMLKSLYKNNIRFDQMTFPDKNHGISGGNTRLYLYTSVFDFLQNKL